MTTSKEQPLIFESPDGGKTVYVRVPGKLDRHLHSVDPVWEKEKLLQDRWLNLKPAVYMADTDPTLNDALTKLEMLYVLKKKE